MTIQFRQLNGQADKTVWRTVDLGDPGSFEIELRRPRWGELTEDGERFAGYIRDRMEKAVVGWRGVEREHEHNGEKTMEPVPFSWENFVAFCEACPLVFQSVGRLVSALYAGITEDAEKNSGEPSSAP